MRNYTFLILIIFVFVASVSCKRNLSEISTNNENVETMQDLIVPIDFNWETNNEVDIILSLHATKAYQPKYKISVLKNAPDSRNGLLATGSIIPGKAFTGKLSLPAYIQELTLICESPFGARLTETLPIQGGMVSHTFSFEKMSPEINSNQFKAGDDPGPDCTEGCDVYISGGGTVNISGGLTYCIADDFDGKINFQNWAGGGTLRVCGTARITNNQYLESNSHIVVSGGGFLNLNKNVQLSGASMIIYSGAEVILGATDLGDNASFTVYENATVAVKKFNGWGANAPIDNSGTITVLQDSYHYGAIHNTGSMIYQNQLEHDGPVFYNGNFLRVDDIFICYGFGSEIENDGEIQVVKDFEYGSNVSFTNNGIVNTDDSFKIYNNGNLINNGTITAHNDCDFSTNGNFINNCSLKSSGDIEFSSEINIEMNTGYLKAENELNFWNNYNVVLNDNCMIIAGDSEIGCDFTGTGNLSSYIILNDLSIWNSSDQFDGSIEVATASGDLNAGGNQNFINGAYYTSIADALNYLPITACNPEGFGTPTVIDMDFDGVPDALDDFPNDPKRAFISYFPNDIEYATVAFEDLWPSKGDYDFNDLVVAVYGSEVTNADDMLIDIRFNFVVLAVGASYDNGFAFQLETITPASVESVSGMILGSNYTNIASNGLEESQSKAVVIVTESVNDIIHRPGGSFFNTVKENPTGTSDTIQIVLTFTEPVNRLLFGLDIFNPFIIKNQERSVEIHLAGFPPTDLMDNDLFGTGDDASNPVAGIFYITTTNLPWGLFMLEPFDYPKEEARIIQTYNHFDTWAQSGGNNYNDWYLNFSGYRNSTNVY
ncbi:MAG: LruC domain-containing protein [Bacteroidales bacterium]|nr:LruC domain-containing protein [Bacteroidales bacterium]